MFISLFYSLNSNFSYPRVHLLELVQDLNIRGKEIHWSKKIIGALVQVFREMHDGFW